MSAVLTPTAKAVHAFLAPSSAHRWRHCTASPWMESQFPDLGDDQPAREGEACHWVMENRLALTPVAEGVTAPNGVAVTAAMLQGVELLARDIEARLGPNWQQMIQVERPVAIPRVHAANWGTPDVRAWAQYANGRRALFIWDLKFGFKRVEVFENDQLVDYAAGCLSEANTTDPFGQRAAFSEASIDVVLVVVQPRAYHPDGPVREWVTPATGLRNQIHALSMAAEEATSPTPVCRPQPDACENCRARSGCDALQAAVYRGMDIARAAVPRVLSDEALGLELATLVDVERLIEARKSGLEELVKSRLTAGHRIPHWAYGPGQGGTKWTKPAAEVQALGRMFKVDLAKPLEVMTPLQAEAAGLPRDYMRSYTQTVTGAVKLVRSTDASARKVFSMTNV